MQSHINTDVYWGEFSEAHMDRVLALCAAGKWEEVKEYIDTVLHRREFVFGKARSDFLYAVDPQKDWICLDIGCGLGVHTFNLAPLVNEVHACDLSRKRAEFCEYRKQFDQVPQVSVHHSDTDHLPFAENTFDFIMMNGVVEWLGERNQHHDPREDQIEVLRKVRSWLKPGGILYIGIENRYALTYLHHAKDHNRLKYTTFMPRFLANWITRLKTRHPYRTYTYGVSGYKKLLQESGFDPQRIQFFIAHPGYNLPQYMIDYTDLSAFRFFFASVYGSRPWWKYVRYLVSRDWFVRLARHGFYSYAMFVAK